MAPARLAFRTQPFAAISSRSRQIHMVRLLQTSVHVLVGEQITFAGEVVGTLDGGEGVKHGIRMQVPLNAKRTYHHVLAVLWHGPLMVEASGVGCVIGQARALMPKLMRDEVGHQILQPLRGCVRSAQCILLQLNIGGKDEGPAVRRTRLHLVDYCTGYIGQPINGS